MVILYKGKKDIYNVSEYKASNLFNLKGQVAIVTGASRGLGQEIAKSLAANGADLALCARDVDKVKLLADSIEKEYGVKTFSMKVDLTEPIQVEEFMKRTYQTFGHIEILVNNAAISGSTILAMKPKKEGQSDIEITKSIISDNYKMITLVTQEAAKYMVLQHYGRIVNIASVYGLMDNRKLMVDSIYSDLDTEFKIGDSDMHAYFQSKQITIMKTIHDANKYGEEGITVNAIAPSLIQLGKKVDGPTNQYWKDKAIIDAEIFPENIIPEILSLVSQYSSTRTGTVTPIDSGWKAKELIRDNCAPEKTAKKMEKSLSWFYIKKALWSIVYLNPIALIYVANRSDVRLEDGEKVESNF